MNEALSMLFDNEEHRRQRFIAALWQNWSMILGEELAGIALPMGHKEQTLVIGAEDNMAMQELSMQSPEILERVNAFMDQEYFSKVKVVLMLGQRPLRTEPEKRSVSAPRSALPPKPPRLGSLHGKMDPDSVVAACYQAYAALFGK